MSMSAPLAAIVALASWVAAPPMERQLSLPVEVGEGSDALADDPSPEADGRVGPQLPAWLEGLSVGVFADVYASLSFKFPGVGVGDNGLRAFDRSPGFALAWAGAVLRWDGPRAAAVLDLRLGPAARAGWAVDELPGLEHLKQGYVIWKLHPKIAVEAGRFDTIYGAESSNSWTNPTYTRGLLFNLAQPFWHTGLRVPACVSDALGLKFMIVNGWGQLIDNNRGKSYGAQLSVRAGDDSPSLCPGGDAAGGRAPYLTFTLGYLGGPESDEELELAAEDPEQGSRVVTVPGVNGAFRHLVDVVVSVELEQVSLTFNADYAYDNAPLELGGDSQWYGAMFRAGYRRERLQLGARTELLADPDGWMSGTEDVVLGSLTGAVGWWLSPRLLMRLEGRYDLASHAVFPGRDAGSRRQLTTTLSLAVASF